METYDRLTQKWAPVLNEGTEIKDAHRRAVTAVVLENQEKEFAAQSGQAAMLNEAGPGIQF